MFYLSCLLLSLCLTARKLQRVTDKKTNDNSGDNQSLVRFPRQDKLHHLGASYLGWVIFPGWLILGNDRFWWKLSRARQSCIIQHPSSFMVRFHLIIQVKNRSKFVKRCKRWKKYYSILKASDQPTSWLLFVYIRSFFPPEVQFWDLNMLLCESLRFLQNTE